MVYCENNRMARTTLSKFHAFFLFSQPVGAQIYIDFLKVITFYTKHGVM